MSVSTDSIKKHSVDSKTGNEKVIEIQHQFRAVPLNKMNLVCKKCGWEQPISQIGMYSPLFCPKGCGVTDEHGKWHPTMVTVEVTKNLSQDRFSTDLKNLQIRDKLSIRRLR